MRAEGTMGPLAKTVIKQIESLGRDRGELAAAIDEAAGVEGASPGADEMEAKLANLLEGQSEGIDFFFDDAWRLEALSRALEIDVSTLQAARVEQEAFRVLVLDRRLDLASRRYLKRRQAKNEDRFSVIEPDDSTQEALLDAALGVRGAIVVLADEEQVPTFDEVGIETTLVYWHRRGYVLSAAEDLVPLPPAPPPKLVDDDGMPMVPHEEYEQRILEAKKSSDEQERVRAITEQGGVPTFRANELVLYLTRVLDGGGGQWIPSPAEFELFEGWLARSSEAAFWCHDSKLFYSGQGGEDVLEVLREHHRVELPTSFSRAVKRLDALNPFLCVDEVGEARFKGRWEEVRQEVSDDCGVDISGAFPSWRKRVEVRAEPRPHVFVQRAPALEAKARAALEALVARPMSIDVREADLVFVLRAMVNAALVVVPPEPFDQFYVVADLGGGRLVWARALAFVDEEPRPLRRVEDGAPWEGYEDAICLDGGDVRVWMVARTSALLATPERVER